MASHEASLQHYGIKIDVICYSEYMMSSHIENKDHGVHHCKFHRQGNQSLDSLKETSKVQILTRKIFHQCPTCHWVPE